MSARFSRSSSQALALFGYGRHGTTSRGGHSLCPGGTENGVNPTLVTYAPEYIDNLGLLRRLFSLATFDTKDGGTFSVAIERDSP